MIIIITGMGTTPTYPWPITANSSGRPDMGIPPDIIYVTPANIVCVGKVTISAGILNVATELYDNLSIVVSRNEDHVILTGAAIVAINAIYTILNKTRKKPAGFHDKKEVCRFFIGTATFIPQRPYCTDRYTG